MKHENRKRVNELCDMIDKENVFLEQLNDPSTQVRLTSATGYGFQTIGTSNNSEHHLTMYAIEFKKKLIQRTEHRILEFKQELDKL